VGGPLLYDRACAACARCIDWSISACMDPVGVTLKCLPHEKSARGKIITDFICHPLIKLSTAPSTVSPFSARPFPRKSLFPGQQFIDKNPSRPSGRRAEQIFVSKLSAGEIFLGRGAILYWDTGRCNTGHWLLTYWSGIQSQPPAGLSVCLSLSLSLCFSVCLHKSDPTHAFLSPRRNTLPWGWNVALKNEIITGVGSERPTSWDISSSPLSLLSDDINATAANSLWENPHLTKPLCSKMLLLRGTFFLTKDPTVTAVSRYNETRCTSTSAVIKPIWDKPLATKALQHNPRSDKASWRQNPLKARRAYK